MSARKSFDRLRVLMERPAALGYAQVDNEAYGQTVVSQKGATQRGPIAAALAEAAHKAFTSDEIGDELEAIALDGFDELSTVEQRLCRRLATSYLRARALPSDFVGETAQVHDESHAAWIEARKANDWGIFAPHLAKVVELARQRAVHYGANPFNADDLYDKLLEGYEPGLTTGELRRIFEGTKAWLIPLLERVRSEGVPQSREGLRRRYPVAIQKDLVTWLAKTLGFDSEAGKLATAVHPFMETLGPDDVLITTRFDEQYWPMAFFGIAHECGHAMYEQGRDPLFHWMLPSRNGLYVSSHAVHEGMSRLWENLVARSHQFLTYFVSEHPRENTPDDLYRMVNAVTPSKIRVQADELNYFPHILLRFELELALLAGTLSVDDLPDAFAEKTREYLGVVPENISEGAGQDIHLSMGLFGYFPTYALGGMVGPQVMAIYQALFPHWQQQWVEGDFSSLRSFLQEHVYRNGLASTMKELLTDVTGEPLNPTHWEKYMKSKFTDLCLGSPVS